MNAGSEDILREIAHIEKDIEELLGYRSEMEARHRAAIGWWARYKAGLQYVLVKRQVENHLRYLKLQRRIAEDSLQELEKADQTDGPAR